MPTPNDTGNAAITPSSLRQTCPPEDERLIDAIVDHESRSERSDTPVESVDSEAPSRTTAASTVSDVQDSASTGGKERIGDDFVPLRDTPSPMSAMEESSEADPRYNMDDVDRIPMYPDGLICSPYQRTRVRLMQSRAVVSSDFGSSYQTRHLHS